MHHWEYQGTLDPSKHFGFLYLIINKATGRRYLGIKQFSFKKGGKRVASDWETYTGSSKWLNADISKQGKDNFKFIIIAVYPDKPSLKYAEVKAIIEHNALWDDNYYNQFLGAKIRNLKQAKNK